MVSCTYLTCKYLWKQNWIKVYNESESEVAQLCLTLSDPMDCSPPGSSVHGILHVLMPFSQIIPPPSPTESKRLFYTSVSLLLSRLQGYRYHLSKFLVFWMLSFKPTFSLSSFTFMHWRRKWQPTPVFLPGESHGWGSLVGCRLWGCTELDKTEVT